MNGFRLEGRTAVVTGGARGLGAAVVRHLSDAGVRGVVLDLEGASDLPPGWRGHLVDVRDEASLAGGFAEVARVLGELDIVVAAAGVVPPWRRVAALDAAEWDTVFDANVRGLALSLSKAAPLLSRESSVVAIASLNSWRGDPNLMSYVASKHAVLGVVRSAALDLGPSGTRVNAVGPGPIATQALLGRMERRSAQGGRTVQQALEEAAAGTALRRMATVDEVAAAVLFLASPLSSGTTGHLLPVDAGIA